VPPVLWYAWLGGSVVLFAVIAFLTRDDIFFEDYGLLGCVSLAWPLILVLLVVVVASVPIVILGRRAVHRDEYGTLYRESISFPWFGPRRTFVRVKDSTGTYDVDVPYWVERAKQAVAWSYDIQEDKYNPIRY
jgi:hypothetical protein